MFPSSHSSTPALTNPSPQIASLHKAHESLLTLLLSSHCSPDCKTPLPHVTLNSVTINLGSLLILITLPPINEVLK